MGQRQADECDDLLMMMLLLLMMKMMVVEIRCYAMFMIKSPSGTDAVTVTSHES